MSSEYESSCSHESVDDVMARLAAARYGVFTSSDALRAGATKSMIQRRSDGGRWVRIYPGVYRVNGAPPSWAQQLTAACLAWRPAFASHCAAGVLWEIPGSKQGAIEIVVSRHRRPSRDGVIIHRSTDLTDADTTVVRGIPVTTATRTLVDLAGIWSKDKIEEALDDALRRRLTTLARIRRQMASMGRRPGIALMRSVVDERSDGSPVPQSVFETRLLQSLKRAGLPEPVRQFEIWDGRRLVAVVDFAFPVRRIAVEADGYRWHSGRRHWERDLLRRNRITALGWRVIHVTWSRLTTHPEDVIHFIEEAIRRGT